MALTDAKRRKLYQAKRFIGQDLEEEFGLMFHLDSYMQDPWVAEQHPGFGMDEDFMVDWEPGLADGPTSSRFAVVDYNSDTGFLTPPARWYTGQLCFKGENGRLDRNNCDSLQFHQVNVWAVLQKALRFFEEGMGLGRVIPWGFEGNRLIVVPHAGYGENAFYDRYSKSLQFYYFEGSSGTVYTCLSADIINHEFGHAVLDGIRPLYHETVAIETAAFHEFIGDLSAILILLRNNNFRNELVKSHVGNLLDGGILAGIAEQFGSELTDKPYLRSAGSTMQMADVSGLQSPHHVSQVMTGAMFDIILAISNHYIEQRGNSKKEAFNYTIQRMQRMAIQPLDLLPPMDATFRDYALAVLRAEEVANPVDPYNYRQMMTDIFVRRGILEPAGAGESAVDDYHLKRPPVKIYYSVAEISRSREAAYRFLNDNRESLYIPDHQDIIVTGLYCSRKKDRDRSPLPKQTVLMYMWREDIVLEGERFGIYQGRTTAMLCGGTLVLDEHGNLLHWVRKPGTEKTKGKDWQDEAATGRKRREEFLDNIAGRIAAGMVGGPVESSSGLLGARIPPFIARTAGQRVAFELAPSFRIKPEEHQTTGERQWQISS